MLQGSIGVHQLRAGDADVRICVEIGEHRWKSAGLEECVGVQQQKGLTERLPHRLIVGRAETPVG